MVNYDFYTLLGTKFHYYFSCDVSRNEQSFNIHRPQGEIYAEWYFLTKKPILPLGVSRGACTFKFFEKCAQVVVTGVYRFVNVYKHCSGEHRI